MLSHYSYQKELEQAFHYIENHLKQNIDSEEVARAANFSYFHFHRIFYSMTGEMIGDYIRKRRLTEAAIELLTSDKLILDIALDYQFTSQEAFHRSFKNTFGLTPALFRKRGTRPIMLQKPPLIEGRFRHRIEKISLQPIIEEILSGIRIMGIKKEMNLDQNRFMEIWSQFYTRSREISQKNLFVNQEVAYGICTADGPINQMEMTSGTRFMGIAGMESTKQKDIPEGFCIHTIPKGSYAVFRHQYTGATLRDTYDYIWCTWLPSSEYVMDDRDNFERYGPEFTSIDDPTSIIYLYIPIKRKNKESDLQ
ncbi:GyrI-like domain-containing protein [Brevibacillus daliensis]|uniref:GyrI-like domain-containing protein n=1 Tax=Brevibacillus daliensis TaxID=2892995 RepID=UPI001E5F8CC0|nr:GyrI-like domain-containing protein [Brevibacillus daliensis]